MADVGPRARVAAGAGAAAVVAWAAYALLRPSLDLDSAFYNLPQISGWLANGKPGSIGLVSFYYPIGNYPLTNEVLMTWVGAVSGNIGFVLLWPFAAAAMLMAAIYATLRALGCEIRIAVGAALAVLLVPIVTESLTSLDSDLPAVAWAAAAVALSVRVAVGVGSPALIPFAILGLGLAIGTKATVAPIGLVALGIALWVARHRLRLTPIALALGAAVAVGGVWYLRNLIDHGNPLWPFTSIPGSDPLPKTLDYLSAPFIGSPLDTLDGRVGDYVDRLGAGLLLIVAGIVLPLFTREPPLMLCSGGVALSLLLWTMAPATGEPSGADAEIFQVSGARYLMGTIILAAGVVAVVAMRGGPGRNGGARRLGGAVAWGVVGLALGRDGVPSGVIVGGAVLVGAGLAWVAVSGGLGARLRPAALSGAAVLCALIAAVALAAYPDRFLDRFAAHSGSVENPLEDASTTYDELAVWFDGQEGFTAGSDPVFFTEIPIGPLIGGDLTHELVLLPVGSGCDAVEEMAPGAWAVIGLPADRVAPPITECFRAEESLLTLETPGGGAFLVFRRSGAGLGLID